MAHTPAPNSFQNDKESFWIFLCYCEFKSKMLNTNLINATIIDHHEELNNA